MRLVLKISKHTVTQNSSLTRFTGSTKSDMKTWYPIITQPSTWERGSETSTLAMYFASKNPHIDALASLAASLALPAGAAEKVPLYSHDLYCLKLTHENGQILAGNLQVKETLETSASPELRDWRFQYIDYALYDISPDEPKEAAATKRKAPK